MWSKLWIFTDNNGNGGGTLWGSVGLRNCNVNNNDNGIGNSGEALRVYCGFVREMRS